MTSLEQLPTYRPALALRLRHIFLGNPLQTLSENNERLGVFGAISVFSADALSSVAYATEEILIALSVAGVAALTAAWPIALAIALLLLILIVSYRQTVAAYPSGGGAYVVAQDQLGKFPALIAAASLTIDYILTVAVSVTAGIKALSSGMPALGIHPAILSIVVIILIAWLNLRGMRESARILSAPVYAFIAVILALGAYGVIATSMGINTPPLATKGNTLDPFSDLQGLGLILLLRAFAGGCTAMTGIEAVANAGNILADPPAEKARWVLVLMGAALAAMFLSISWIAVRLGLQPMDQESIISQIAHHFWGQGIAYWAVQILTAFMLVLAANTAFAGMPKLGSMLAKDGWLPRQLGAVGDRLVYSNGIYLLAGIAIGLVVAFQGDTHRLIPLYAVGVFTAFTISQAGMVNYWRKARAKAEGGRKRAHLTGKIIINAIGTLATGVTLLVTIEAKFSEGAFLVVIAIPALIAVCWLIHRHYILTEEKLAVDIGKVSIHHKFTDTKRRPIIVPMARIHRGTIEGLMFAREMSADVTVVLVDIDHARVETVRQALARLDWGVKVEILQSPYRAVVQPIVDFIKTHDRERNELSVVVLAQLSPTRFWYNFLHNGMADAIRQGLTYADKTQGCTRCIVQVPYYLDA